VTITRAGPGGTKTWTVTTNAGGAFTMTSTPPGGGSYAYTAFFSGTPDLSPAAATLRVTVPLPYHRAKRLTMAAAVAPNKAGECVQLQLEEYEKGVWRDGGNSKCIALGKTSAIGVALTLARASVGYPYRLRVDYLRGSDDRNLSADSGWDYCIVEK
jgi:hypothetical protein